MHHSLPYLILSFFSAGALLYVLLHKKSLATAGLFLSFVGLVYVFEFIVLVLFDCYVYYPHLIKNNYLDSMFGAFISNFLAVPVAGIIIVTYRLRAIWIIAFTLMFTCIEWLFLHLGIYEHHWWRTPYTTAGLLLFFWTARYWSNQTALGRRPFSYFTLLLLLSFSAFDTLSFFQMLFGLRRFHLGIYANPIKDDVFLTVLFALINILILATVVYRTTAVRWIAAALAVMIAFNVTMVLTGILQLYISVWLYYLIYVPLCLLIAWLIFKIKHSLDAMRAHH